MKQLYNEGRVLGYSSYESYVREVLSIDPNAELLTEREWLAATMSVNNSMILKIAAGTSRGYHDYELPEGSDLCSCTWIIGSIFEGEAEWDDDDMWATSVYDYGRLVSNTGGLHPVTPGRPDNVPPKPTYMTLSDTYIAQCTEYMKIGTGLAFQPGTWTSNIYQVPLTTESGVELTTQRDQVILADMSDTPAAMSFKANLAGRGFVRLVFKEVIQHDLYLLLRGFCHKSLLMSLYGDLAGGIHPKNGDFLGPELFPWATTILFNYSNDMMSIFSASMSDVSAEIEELRTEIRALTQGQSVISEEAAEALRRAQSAANEAEQALLRVNAAAETIEQTQAEAYRLANTVSGLSSDVSGLSGSVSGLSSDIAGLSSDLSDLSDDVIVIEQSAGDIVQAVAAVNNKIGSLNNLATTDKSNVVAAVNETYNGSKNALLYK